LGASELVKRRNYRVMIGDSAFSIQPTAALRLPLSDDVPQQTSSAGDVLDAQLSE
jgi:hypothetical protein